MILLQTTQYGLAFIKFHSPPTEADNEAEAAEAGKKTVCIATLLFPSQIR